MILKWSSERKACFAPKLKIGWRDSLATFVKDGTRQNNPEQLKDNPEQSRTTQDRPEQPAELARTSCANSPHFTRQFHTRQTRRFHFSDVLSLKPQKINPLKVGRSLFREGVGCTKHDSFNHSFFVQVLFIFHYSF